MITISRTVALNAPVRVENLSGYTFDGEREAHHFAIAAVDNFEDNTPQPLSGQVVAYLIQANGATQTVNGYVGGGIAHATLSKACYDVPGRFVLSIFNVDDTERTCIYACTGTVYRTRTDRIIDGGSVVPDMDDVIAEYAAMRRAEEQCRTAAAAVQQYSVRFDIQQSLSSSQKTQARDNIYAASPTDVGAVRNMFFNAWDSETDLDNYLEPRVFILFSDTEYQHAPVTLVPAMLIVNSPSAEPTTPQDCYQRFIDFSTGAIYVRRYNDSLVQWEPWVAISDKAVRFDVQQNLSSAQKVTARNNIGVASKAYVDDILTALASKYLAGGSDLNNTTEFGNYQLGEVSEFVNAPTGASGAGFLSVISGSMLPQAEPDAYQILIEITTGNLYIRSYLNDAWSTWGGGGSGDSKYVRFDAAQTLTAAQQTQVRNNLGLVAADDGEGNITFS